MAVAVIKSADTRARTPLDCRNEVFIICFHSLGNASLAEVPPDERKSKGGARDDTDALFVESSTKSGTGQRF